jgi:hypothetical protein
MSGKYLTLICEDGAAMIRFTGIGKQHYGSQFSSQESDPFTIIQHEQPAVSGMQLINKTAPSVQKTEDHYLNQSGTDQLLNVIHTDQSENSDFSTTSIHEKNQTAETHSKNAAAHQFTTPVIDFNQYTDARHSPAQNGITNSLSTTRQNDSNFVSDNHHDSNTVIQATETKDTESTAVFSLTRNWIDDKHLKTSDSFQNSTAFNQLSSIINENAESTTTRYLDNVDSSKQRNDKIQTESFNKEKSPSMSFSMTHGWGDSTQKIRTSSLPQTNSMQPSNVPIGSSVLPQFQQTDSSLKTVRDTTNSQLIKTDTMQVSNTNDYTLKANSEGFPKAGVQSETKQQQKNDGSDSTIKENHSQKSTVTLQTGSVVAESPVPKKQSFQKDAAKKLHVGTLDGIKEAGANHHRVNNQKSEIEEKRAPQITVNRLSVKVSSTKGNQPVSQSQSHMPVKPPAPMENTLQRYYVSPLLYKVDI